MTKEKTTLKIKEYYDQALVLIKAKKIKDAALIIHDKMGPKLYDISLDIEFNTNEPSDDDEFIFNKQLKTLITKVNLALCKESLESFDDSKDVQESEVNSSDKEWFSESAV